MRTRQLTAHTTRPTARGKTNHNPYGSVLQEASYRASDLAFITGTLYDRLTEF